MKIYLDNIDITEDIQKQTPVPHLSGGVYPNMGTKWYNMLSIVQNHPELATSFSKGGLHSFRIEDAPGYGFSAKVILRLCYSARNS